MIELKHLSKTFETAGGRVDALKDVSLTIPDGDVYGIIGMSGAGKSTLVRCINMLERPTEGEVIVNGQRLDTMTPAQLRAARREITMIFQRFNLLMQRNCLDNVCFPMELSGLRGEIVSAKQPDTGCNGQAYQTVFIQTVMVRTTIQTITSHVEFG